MCCVPSEWIVTLLLLLSQLRVCLHWLLLIRFGHILQMPSTNTSLCNEHDFDQKNTLIKFMTEIHVHLYLNEMFEKSATLVSNKKILPNDRSLLVVIFLASTWGALLKPTLSGVIRPWTDYHRKWHEMSHPNTLHESDQHLICCWFPVVTPLSLASFPG